MSSDPSGALYSHISKESAAADMPDFSAQDDQIAVIKFETVLACLDARQDNDKSDEPC